MTDRLDKESAITEAIGVQSIAGSLVEMGEANESKSFQLASEYLDLLRVEAPGTADMMIQQANQWREIEGMVPNGQLEVLKESSKEIASTREGIKLLRGLSRIIGDKERVVEELKLVFDKSPKLNNILGSKPGLSDLWYNHLFITLNLAIAGIEGERSGELP